MPIICRALWRQLQVYRCERFACGLLLLSAFNGTSVSADQPALRPVVEAEEEVYRFEPADNGATPLWCHGSTCLVRIGDDIFASGLETLKNVKPLNNCRWLLFHREHGGWRQVAADEQGRTREPSPLAAFPDGPLFLSANPTAVTDPSAYNGPSRPEILEFEASSVVGGYRVISPSWDGEPEFTEHSYRSFAADAATRELILFQNIGYTHAEWAYRNSEGAWESRGQLNWPWGADYDKPQPIRICYPNVAIRNRAVYFCGVSDIVEPYEAWRTFKKNLTGQEWDYDFRRLFYTWSQDIRTGKFHDWIEIASRDTTCGWILPGDLWVAPEGVVHIVWNERFIDERLRDRFFPGVLQRHAINYAVVREGQIISRATLVLAEEGTSALIPSEPRFQVTQDNKLYLFYYLGGTDAKGQPVSENRVLEIAPDSTPGPSARVPLQHPMNSYFTATVRAGSPPSNVIEAYGTAAGEPNCMRYAKIRLYE